MRNSTQKQWEQICTSLHTQTMRRLGMPGKAYRDYPRIEEETPADELPTAVDVDLDDLRDVGITAVEVDLDDLRDVGITAVDVDLDL
jgi:hypothetical protein